MTDTIREDLWVVKEYMDVGDRAEYVAVLITRSRNRAFNRAHEITKNYYRPFPLVRAKVFSPRQSEVDAYLELGNKIAS